MNNLTLPIFLEPIYETDLVRVGNNFDGGYIVEKNSIKQSEILLSFGLSDDWTFEEDYSKLAENKEGKKEEPKEKIPKYIKKKKGKGFVSTKSPRGKMLLKIQQRIDARNKRMYGDKKKKKKS